jgi:hypothetical protein
MALRRLLRQAGFQNVRIVDALFLVQARTPGGNQVLMAVNPPNRNSQGFAPGSVPPNQSSGSDQQFGNQGGRNFGSIQGDSSESNHGQMPAPQNHGEQGFGSGQGASSGSSQSQMTGTRNHDGSSLNSSDGSSGSGDSGSSGDNSEEG